MLALYAVHCQRFCPLTLMQRTLAAAPQALMQRPTSATITTLSTRAHLAELLQVLLRQLPRAQDRVIPLHPEGQVIRRVDLR